MDAARQQYHPELPPLEYTATTFGNTVDNLWWIGQDATFWVKEGYVDVLLPMLYVQTVEQSTFYFLQSQNLTGGVEGIIPVAPLLTHVAHGPTKTPEAWSQEVYAVMQNGADGWSSWAYGGPGDNSGWPDIRPYWELVPRPPIFSLSNISVSRASDSATITWMTDLPASSKVEYSTAPLFNASKIKAPSSEYPYAQLDYWDIDHVPGLIVEEATPKTSHSVTLTGLSPGVTYYFRIQSQDSSGTATSKVYTFQL
jgi:hypothetical protein